MKLISHMQPMICKSLDHDIIAGGIEIILSILRDISVDYPTSGRLNPSALCGMRVSYSKKF